MILNITTNVANSSIWNTLIPSRPQLPDGIDGSDDKIIEENDDEEEVDDEDDDLSLVSVESEEAF